MRRSEGQKLTIRTMWGTATIRLDQPRDEPNVRGRALSGTTGDGVGLRIQPRAKRRALSAHPAVALACQHACGSRRVGTPTNRCPLELFRRLRISRIPWPARRSALAARIRHGPNPPVHVQQMVAVAELEAGLISARTKAALAAAKKRGLVATGCGAVRKGPCARF